MKKIKPSEPFQLHNTVFTYSVDGNNIHLKKGKDVKAFVPPTLDEVRKFFGEKGYNNIGADKAWNHYELGEPKWTDSRGTPVKAWKQKMANNWFKDEYKIVDKIETSNIGENLVDLGHKMGK